MAAYRDVAGALDRKVPGERRSTKEYQVWAVVDGRKVTRITYPKPHSKKADVPVGTLNSIRRQLGLEQDQFRQFVDCTMSADEYVRVLRSRLASEDAAKHAQDVRHEVTEAAGRWTCSDCGLAFPPIK